MSSESPGKAISAGRLRSLALKASGISTIALVLFALLRLVVQAPRAPKTLSFLLDDTERATRLSQALEANTSAASELLDRAGRPEGAVVPLDPQSADRLLELSQGAPGAEYLTMEALLHPTSPTERMIGQGGMPSAMVRIQESPRYWFLPSIEVDLVADEALVIVPRSEDVELRLGAVTQLRAPTSELRVSELEPLVSGRRVVVDGPIDDELAARLYAAGIRGFHSPRDVVRASGHAPRPVRLILVASEHLLPGRSVGSTSRALATVLAVPGSVVVESRSALSQAVDSARQDGVQPVVVFHNDPARGILFEDGPMSLQEFAELGADVFGISCNTYRASGITYRTTGELDFEIVAKALAQVTTQGNAAVDVRDYLDMFGSEYNRILETQSRRERILFGGLATLSATPVVGGIVVENLPREDEKQPGDPRDPDIE